jgi:hypothetical protein
MKRHIIYYKGREWCLLPKVLSHVKLVFEVVLFYHNLGLVTKARA